MVRGAIVAEATLFPGTAGLIIFHIGSEFFHHFANTRVQYLVLVFLPAILVTHNVLKVLPCQTVL